MEPRKSGKEFRKTKQHDKETGLPCGVAKLDAKPLDRAGNKFLDFLVYIFLFLLGGVILCSMLLALLTMT